jgi:hypothetical protein
MTDYAPRLEALDNQDVRKYEDAKNRRNKIRKATKAKAITLLVAGAMAAYSVFQDKLPEQFHLDNVIANTADIFLDDKEALYLNDTPKLYDYVETAPEDIADASIDNIVIQWEKTRPGVLGSERIPIKSDVGTMYLMQGETIVRQIPVAGGIYETADGEYSRAGEATSPHDGEFELGFYVENPEYHTPNGLIEGGASNNPFGRGLWTIFTPGSENYERFQLHGIRPANEGKGNRLSAYSGLGPTIGCIRMSNDDIELTRRILDSDAKITFADTPRFD